MLKKVSVNFLKGKIMRYLMIGFLLCVSGLTHAQTTYDHRNLRWNTLLQNNVHWVRGGLASEVDYSGFKRDEKDLTDFLDELSTVSRQEFDAWSKYQQLAFLLNAYNAFTVKLVLEHYPVKSIKDVGSIFQSPWSQAFIPLLGQTISLDYLEHSLIRRPGVYNDPRIHFAVNCASIGCPALRNEAFNANQLDTQLADGQRRFLSDRTRNRFNPKTGRLELSKIFDWYGQDFAGKWGSLEKFLSLNDQLLTDEPSVRERIEQGIQLDFLEYDWSLNQSS